MTEGAANPQFAGGLLFEYMALTNVLDRDVVSARTVLLAGDSQFARRQFARVVVADIEATVGCMIQVALRIHRAGAEPFTPEEYALLQERVSELRDPNAPFEPTARLTTKANIRFAFSVFTRALHTEYTLPFDDDGWSTVLTAIAIRDRITLPRSAGDLEVSPEEMRTLHEADIWFDKRCAEALRSTGHERSA
jgi:hypothetical protein